MDSLSTPSRHYLYERLAGLSPGDFAAVVASIPEAGRHISGPAAAQTQRADELMLVVENRAGSLDPLAALLEGRRWQASIREPGRRTQEATVSVELVERARVLRRRIHLDGSLVHEGAVDLGESSRLELLLGKRSEWSDLSLRLFGVPTRLDEVVLHMRIISDQATLRWLPWWETKGPGGEPLVKRGWTFVAAREVQPVHQSIRPKQAMRCLMFAPGAPDAQLHAQDLANKMRELWPDQRAADAVVPLGELAEIARIARDEGAYRWFLYLYGAVDANSIVCASEALVSVPPPAFVFASATARWSSIPLILPPSELIVVRRSRGTAPGLPSRAAARHGITSFLDCLGLEGHTASGAVAHIVAGGDEGVWNVFQQAETFRLMPSAHVPLWRQVRHRLDRETQRRRSVLTIREWQRRGVGVGSLVVIGSGDDSPGDLGRQLLDEIERDRDPPTPVGLRQLAGLRWSGGFSPRLSDQLRFVFDAEPGPGALAAAARRRQRFGASNSRVLMVEAGPWVTAGVEDLDRLISAWVEQFDAAWRDEVPTGWLVVGVASLQVEGFEIADANRLDAALDGLRSIPFRVLQPLTELSRDEVRSFLESDASVGTGDATNRLVDALWRHSAGRYLNLCGLLKRGLRDGWLDLLAELEG